MKPLHNRPFTPALAADAQRRLQIVAAVQDEERARIARDLHDQLGQEVTALRLVLEQHQAECRVNSQTAIVKALRLVSEIDAEIDSLAWGLRPGVVDNLGLAASLRQLVGRWVDTARVDAECQCDLEGGPLSEDAELTVYRVAQEALHNVLKHAHATRVSVISELRDGYVMLIVQDDGVGFDLSDECDAADGMGLRGMRERAGLVGGTLQVESVRGRGTTVSLQIPIVAAD